MTATVDSWEVVAIPTSDPEAVDAAPESARAATASAATAAASVAPAATAPGPVAPAKRSAAAAPAPAIASPTASSAIGVPPVEFDEADAPPPDEEPPFDPGPEPVIDAVPVAEARPNFAAAAAAASEGGIQRYGEAVVREVLGATFLEEVEAPPRAGFGERG